MIVLVRDDNGNTLGRIELEDIGPDRLGEVNVEHAAPGDYLIVTVELLEGEEDE